MTPPRILGLSASPRNPWQGTGASPMGRHIVTLATRDELLEYIRTQGDLCLEKFLEAGRKQGKAFTEIYANLRKMTRSAGLSNSELALAAALWSAADLGAEVRHVPLSAHFPGEGGGVRLDQLREELLWADGILISGPVYFGDRSSLVKSLQDFIFTDAELRASLRGKLYGGISVGAKRNGGQETTLIYQMVDMLELGMLGVGNDSDTTAQYGGTCHAGDVGTVWKDAYGLDTSMGIGRRMAKVLRLQSSAHQLKSKAKALVLLLQDAGGVASAFAATIKERLGASLDVKILDFSCTQLRRCMACDICPADVENDECYRCLVKNDDMKFLHSKILDHDLLIPIVVSVRDTGSIQGDYQKFMERTRYIRRGDYIWSDMLVAPVVLQEHGSVSTYSLRMLTSFIRHHTVMLRPLVGILKNGALPQPDADEILLSLDEAEHWAARLAAGRLNQALEGGTIGYNPVGYVLSADKNRDDAMFQKRAQLVQARVARLRRLAHERLRPDNGEEAD